MKEKDRGGARVGPQVSREGRPSRESLVVPGHSGCVLPATVSPPPRPGSLNLVLPDKCPPICRLPTPVPRAESCKWGHHRVLLQLPSLSPLLIRPGCLWVGPHSLPQRTSLLGQDRTQHPPNQFQVESWCRFPERWVALTPLEPTVWKVHL